MPSIHHANSLFHAKFPNNLFFSNLWNYNIISQKLRLFILVKIRFKILIMLNVKFGVSVVTSWHLINQFHCFWGNSCAIFRAVILHTAYTVKIFNGFLLLLLYKEAQEKFSSRATWPWRWSLQSLAALVTYDLTWHNIPEDLCYFISFTCGLNEK